MNYRNINDINEKQLSAAVGREGRTVTNAYTGEEYEVLFRTTGSQSISQEKVKIFYPQDTPIVKGMILKYRNTYYMVMNTNDIESDVFISSTLVRCNAKWNLLGTDVYVISGTLSSTSPVNNGLVSGVSGNMSVQTSDIPMLHDKFGVDSEIFAFGGMYKCVNKFYCDGFCFLYFERNLKSDGTYSVCYDGKTIYMSGTYKLNPYLLYSDMCITDAEIVCTSSDETIAVCNGTEVEFLKSGTVDITMASKGTIENGKEVWPYDASTVVSFIVKEEGQTILTADISNWDEKPYAGFDYDYTTILLADGEPVTTQEEVDALATITYQVADTEVVFEEGYGVDNVSWDTENGGYCVTLKIPTTYIGKPFTLQVLANGVMLAEKTIAVRGLS